MPDTPTFGHDRPASGLARLYASIGRHGRNGRLVLALAVLAALMAGIDVARPHKAALALEATPVFYGLAGFAVTSFVVLAARLWRLLVERAESDDDR